MLKIHTSDGLTSDIDFEDPEQTGKWLSKLKNDNFQKTITGVTILYKGVSCSLPKPVGFKRYFFNVEEVKKDPKRKIKGGTRIICQADEIKVTIMVHAQQRAIRVALLKTGKQRFNPNLV